MNWHEIEDMQDEMGAAMGDPRRCPRHPEVAISSGDGMFDGLCGRCEAEMDQDADNEDRERSANHEDGEFDGTEDSNDARASKPWLFED